MKLIFFLIITTFPEVLPKKWIDPHDMNTKSKQKLEKLNHGDLEKTPYRSAGIQDDEKVSLVYLNYLKRVVSLIVNSATASGADMKQRNGKYEFTTDSESYKFLLEFINGHNINIESLRKLDTTLSTVFQKNISDDIFDSVISFQEKVFNLLFNLQTVLVSATIIFLCIVYKLFKSEYTFGYIIRYLLVIILIIDYGLRYRMLYEEAEEHNMKIQYSAKCDTKKMNWGEYFMFLTKQEDCDKKYVTPLEVALSQVKHIIIVPMSAVGTGMGNFANELWVKLPFPWNILIFPSILFFVAIILSIFITVSYGSPFKINLMHLLHFEFGKPNDDKKKVGGATLDRLLNVIGMHHRNMLEDVNSLPDRKKVVEDQKVWISENEANSENSKETLPEINETKKYERKGVEDVNNSSSDKGSSSKVLSEVVSKTSGIENDGSCSQEKRKEEKKVKEMNNSSSSSENGSSSSG